MFAVGQALAEASIRLLHESESRERLASVGQARSTAPTRALLDAEDRLQTFLVGFGYIEAYMLGRRVPGRGGVIEQSPLQVPIIDDEPAHEASGCRLSLLPLLLSRRKPRWNLCQKFQSPQRLQLSPAWLP